MASDDGEAERGLRRHPSQFRSVLGELTSRVAAAHDDEDVQTGPQRRPPQFRSILSEITSRAAGASDAREGSVESDDGDAERGYDPRSATGVAADIDQHSEATEAAMHAASRSTAVADASAELDRWISSRYPSALEGLRSTSGASLRIWECEVHPEDAVELAGVLRRRGGAGLASLHLWRNNLCYEAVKVLSDAMGASATLRSISLENNSIDSSGAKLIALALERNSSLETLGLSINEISDEGARNFAGVLKQNSNLRSLNLGRNFISHKGAKALANVALHHKTLRSLNLQGNRIGNETVQALLNSFRHSTKVIHLDMKLDKYVGGKTGGRIADSLVQASNVRSLMADIISKGGSSGLKMSLQATNESKAYPCPGMSGRKRESQDELIELLDQSYPESLEEFKSSCKTVLKIWEKHIDAEELLRALKRNTSITSVNLWRNNLGYPGALALSNLLTTNTTIVSLNLENNNIDSSGVNLIATSLKRNKCLKTLDLSLNEIGDEGARGLADALEQNSSLMSLNLGRNFVGDKGARALANAAGKSKTVTSLNFHSNQLGSEAAGGLADALASSTKLNYLNLAGNSVGTAGARFLSDALKINNSLETLDLRNSRIGDDGAILLAGALRYNSSLTSLQMKLNLIGNRGTRSLAEALEVNKTLRHLDLSGNSINNAGAAALAGALKTNTTVTEINMTSNMIKLEYKSKLSGPLGRNRVIRDHKKAIRSFGLSNYILPLEGLDPTGRKRRKLMWRRATHCGEGLPVWDAACHDGIAFFLVHRLLENTLRHKDNKTSVTDAFVEAELPSPGELCKLTETCRENGNIRALVDLDTNERGSNILHVAASRESTEALHFCQFLVEIGADFDKVTDAKGRSARDIASANNNEEVVRWARSVGTFLCRYTFEDGPPAHLSATCVVRFARDITTMKENVALKIVMKRSHFERELQMRLTKKVGSGVDIHPDLNRFDEAHAMQLIRYHDEINEKGESIMCFVMPKGERSLDDVIRAERVAGHDIRLIQHFAEGIAKALLHLHSDLGVVHGDVKPRNIIRAGSAYKLIDFDASVKLGDSVGTDKVSTAYCPPELARILFVPNQSELELKEQLKSLSADLSKVSSRHGLQFFEEQIEATRDKIKRVQEGKGEHPLAHPTFDVWSFGVTMYHMLTSVALFNVDGDDNLKSEPEQDELVQWQGLKSAHTRHVLSKASGVSSRDIRSAKDLLNQCLQPNPHDRPQSFAEILSHPFLSRREECQWAPRERNRLNVLFSDPLVWRSNDGELHPVHPRLNFDHERNLLLRCIRNSQKDIALAFDAATCSRLQELSNERCGCLHFSGHGVPESLIFEDGKGGAQFLGQEELSELLIHPEPFKFVFVSACHSEDIGNAFLKAGVKHVVCCEQSSELNHDACADFTFSFYDALAKEFHIELAYSSAKGFVTVKYGKGESNKFKLLPESGNHAIPVFNADLAEMPVMNRSIQSIPAVPSNFLGRETAMYGIVYALLSKQRLVTLVGNEGVGCSSLALAVCHYIKERLNTILSIDDVLYIKLVEDTSDIHEVLLQPLFEMLGDVGVITSSGASEQYSICDALKHSKFLIVLDDVDRLNHSALHNFLQELFGKSEAVRVMLISLKPFNFLSSSVNEECIVVEPLDNEWSARLFSEMCSFSDTWMKRSKLERALLSQLADDCSSHSSQERHVLDTIREGIPSSIIKSAKSMSFSEYSKLAEFNV